MVALTADREVHAVKRTGLKGGIDFERGEKRAAPAPPKPKRPPTENERWIAALQKIDGAKFLNGAIPRDHRTNQPVAPLHFAVCGVKGKCGHSYAAMMRSRDEVCEECRGEAWEERKAAFARELGIGEDEDRGPSIQRVRELAHQQGVIGGPAASINHRS